MEDDPDELFEVKWPAIISLGIITLGCDFALYALWQFARTVFGS